MTNHTVETRATGGFDARDELTGLRGYYTLLNDVEHHAGDKVYVVLCDLDNFRLINDAYGDRIGSQLLVRVGKTVQSCFGDEHTFRYGSDEFLIVRAFDTTEQFLELLATLKERVAAIDFEGKPLHLSMSYGYVYGAIRGSDDLHEAIRFADRKMYEAKRLGKARAVGAPLANDPLLLAHDDTEDKQYRTYEMDELTGLANMIFFRNHLEEQLTAQRHATNMPEGQRAALIYFNVENFKVYNEKFGFDAGDELLLLIANAIKEAFPKRLASRFSADQFMVVATVDTVSEGIRHVRHAFRQRQKASSISLKAGIYIPSDTDVNVGLVMDRAKMACDSIKGRHDIYFCYYNKELQSNILLHRYVLDNFEHALSEGWIKVFYQPIIRVSTGEVCDEEALSRWVDPHRGIISPADFIPVLEEARLIHKLDLYMVERACSNLALIQQRGQQVTPVSVNLSRLDFDLCDIVAEIEKIVSSYGLERRMLSIEITESALSGNAEFLKGEIDRFRKDGFEVWMDDFGSGYSSFHVLNDYNFDLVKVDMGFLRTFDKNEYSRIMLSHIIGMCKELGLKTLVEGVETQEQMEFLRGIGCGRGQGYFFGKPASLVEVEQAMEAQLYPNLEKPGHYDFYEEVGRVNLLRPDPAVSDTGHYVPGDIPAAIVQRRGKTYKYLNVSDVYYNFLQAIGVNTLDESTRRLNDTTHIEHMRMQEGIDVCITSGQWEWITFYEDGKYYSFRAKCIASHPEEDTVAIILVAINVQEASHGGPI